MHTPRSKKRDRESEHTNEQPRHPPPRRDVQPRRLAIDEPPGAGRPKAALRRTPSVQPGDHVYNPSFTNMTQDDFDRYLLRYTAPLTEAPSSPV